MTTERCLSRTKSLDSITDNRAKNITINGNDEFDDVKTDDKSVKVLQKVFIEVSSRMSSSETYWTGSRN